MGVAAYVPWWARIVAKLVLARLPLPYRFWRRLGLFQHGNMNQPEWAIQTFRRYLDTAQNVTRLPENFHSLEIGPGDSILSGLVARALGAQCAWLVDTGAYAETDLGLCRKTLALLAQDGNCFSLLPTCVRAHSKEEGKKKKGEGREIIERGMGKKEEGLEDRVCKGDSECGARDICGGLQDFLQSANVRYLTSGTASLADIPEGSIHFFWSQVVLEHVFKDEFMLFLHALKRVLAPNAVGVHGIDFRDHLGGGLNNLRFSSRVWESSLFRTSGFYTNRIRPREMLAMFEEAGFSVKVLRETRWPKMPICRAQLAQEFQNLSDDDLMVNEIEILLRPNP